jgi:ribosomal protein L37AE/L43A
MRILRERPMCRECRKPAELRHGATVCDSCNRKARVAAQLAFLQFAKVRQ